MYCEQGEHGGQRSIRHLRRVAGKVLTDCTIQGKRWRKEIHHILFVRQQERSQCQYFILSDLLFRTRSVFVSLCVLMISSEKRCRFRNGWLKYRYLKYLPIHAFNSLLKIIVVDAMSQLYNNFDFNILLFPCSISNFTTLLHDKMYISPISLVKRL